MSFLRKKNMALRKKNMAERAAEVVTHRVDGKALVQAGLSFVGSAASLTAVSAVVSSLRKKKQG